MIFLLTYPAKGKVRKGLACLLYYINQTDPNEEKKRNLFHQKQSPENIRASQPGGPANTFECNLRYIPQPRGKKPYRENIAPIVITGL